MRLRSLFFVILCATPIRAQDLASRPDTLKSLKDMLSALKPISWVQTPKPPETSQATHVIATITDVTTDADACRLSFKDGRSYPDQKWESVQTWQIRIPNIGQIRVESLEGFVERLRSEAGQASWATDTNPIVYVLEIQAAANQKFDVHRWSKNGADEVSERDLQQPLAFIILREESAAKELEKVLRRAQAFCTPK